MLFHYTKDVTEVTSGIVAHGCNASGGFGSGVAGAIARKWPEVRQSYIQEFRAEKLVLGYIQPVVITDELTVVNMITQQRYGSDGVKYASIGAIEECMTKLIELAHETHQTIYIPRVGCGLGGLSFEIEFFPLMEKMSKAIEETHRYVDIIICDLP